MTVADVVLARVQAAVGAVLVYDARVLDKPPTKYVVVYPDPGAREAFDLGHTADHYTFRWQITAVGQNRGEAERLATQARDALVAVKLDVAGLSCGVIEHEGSQPIRWDDQIPLRAVMYGTDQYKMTATAA